MKALNKASATRLKRAMEIVTHELATLHVNNEERRCRPTKRGVVARDIHRFQLEHFTSVEENLSSARLALKEAIVGSAIEI